ncbi:MAG: Uma2 family endonuclease [Leptolyngbyaceae cyanobacterium SM1_1_3]|nr:Uma2 family endonuclease [Leptolyngbyaceae cyanobacterium SM1_1_3]NJN04858.1 Uma2 family endonuclease [Leptolyngbyaceae cyanobacterium RM1_1_2]NJO09978.1 Uma2 family endonuclease [Leptolyngbyaceae cyanobacterium SL_1_1]
MVTLQLDQIQIPLGQRIELTNVSWLEFEAILQELGQTRNTRIAYSNGILSIMALLPEHEKAKVLISDLVKVLLEELSVDCESFGSTTFKRQDMAKGIEPDDSFYIQNYAQMIGKDRIDLSVDPPPDLAIEVDLTAKTQTEAYAALGVPELWRYDDNQLQIAVLRQGWYVIAAESPIFPGWPILEMTANFMARSRTVGSSQALREFRA